MIRQVARFLGLAALVAQIGTFHGCSSSGGAADTGSGGSNGSGGTSGAGSGGATGNAADYTPVGDACVNVKNKGTCTVGTDLDCWNTCGPNKTGIKNCTCSSGAWTCPVCGFPPEKDYSCYKLPDPLLACPNDPTDPTGGGLPQSGSDCTLPDCTPCGSSAATAYRDSGGNAKIGYCICIHGMDADGNPQAKYSCASVNEYPPQ